VHRRLYQESLGDTIAQENQQRSDGCVSKDTRNVRPLCENVADRHGYGISKCNISAHAGRQRHTLIQHRKRRHQSECRGTFYSHAEDQDVALFHLQKLTALHRRAAETGRFVQCLLPPLIGMSLNEMNMGNKDHVCKRLLPPQKNARRARWQFELGDRVSMTSL